MAQSESEISDNPQVQTFSDIEAELTALEGQQPPRVADFDIGTTVCAVSNPTVEGLILSKWEAPNGKTEVILLVPGYKKKGHAPCFAAIIRKDSDKLSKRSVRKYAFLLPNLERWQASLKKYKKDLSWTTNAIQTLNAADNDYIIERNTASCDDNVNDKSASAVDVLQTESSAFGRNDNAKKRALISPEKLFSEIPLQEDSADSSVDNHRSSKHRGPVIIPKKKRRSSEKKKLKKYKKAKRSSRKSSDTSDGDTSSSSESDNSSIASSSESEVSDCPFSRNDNRGYAHVKARLKGKSEERKYIRYALHNLYSTYSSLKAVVYDIRSRSLASGAKPLTFDLIWLEQHAIYLDTLMFENLRGVWKYWHEPIVDELALAFLELLVRVSPRREYSDRLDERVRKWMKKRRIGVSQRYGPVPVYLQQAKITEAGILANNNTLSNRRWSYSYNDKGNNNYNSNFRSGFRQNNTAVRPNGVQPAKSPVPTSV